MGLGTNVHSRVASASALVTATLQLWLSFCCVTTVLHHSAS